MAKNLSMQFTIQALQANKNAPEKLSEAIQSTGGRIRTLNLLIRSQVLAAENRDSRPQNADSDERCSNRVSNGLSELIEDDLLRRVVEAWPDLLEPARVAVLAMVEASTQNKGE